MALSDSDLAEFKLYLIEQNSISSGTARVYASHCRRLLTCVVPLTEAGLTDFLYSQITLQGRSTVRAAWNHFRTFTKANLDVTLPEIGKVVPAVAQAAVQDFQPSPPMLRALLLLLNTHKVPAFLLASATWADIQVDPREGKNIFLRGSGSRQVGALFPSSLLSTLCHWADPETQEPKLTQPLIPLVEGGSKAVQAVTLRRLAAKHETETLKGRLEASLAAGEEDSEETPRFRMPRGPATASTAPTAPVAAPILSGVAPAAPAAPAAPVAGPAEAKLVPLTDDDLDRLLLSSSLTPATERLPG